MKVNWKMRWTHKINKRWTTRVALLTKLHKKRKSAAYFIKQEK